MVSFILSSIFLFKFRKLCPTRPEGAEALSPGQWTQAARPGGPKALSPEQWTQAARPERAEALSPGQRPGLLWAQTCRPVRAKASKKIRQFTKLLPLQGALLTVIIPRALPWAKSFCPFRACCLYELLPLQGVLLVWASALAGRAAPEINFFSSLLLISRRCLL